MPVVMHFATFLKYFTLSDGDKIRELQKYSKPGGFDFYRPSRDAITDYFVAGKPEAHCKAFIAASSGANNEEHNLSVFDAVRDWGGKQKVVAEPPSRGVWKSPKKTFSVRIEPEFLIKRNGTDTVVAVYPRSSVALNRDNAGAGIILLQQAYKGSGGEAFGILDAHASKAFWTPTNVSEIVLDNVVRFIDENLPKFVD
ncbi:MULTISPECIES: hypothetical protein [Mameliella]|uniref:hypothetical protein n=1 Tax=Mameliella TaxID=1434019 RepID=UPI001054DE95|nr:MULTISPECIES: hypothetical protein [Mameliella]MBY6118486.1 hypothetical protein [Mameliella alba]MDD9729924.1 hypothetical protein [Mameliella sp. AT18]